MSANAGDARWMAAAIALSLRGRGRTTPNPNVGCVIVKDGAVIGRGWTAPGGRPHAEAVALEQAGPAARGATIHVTLEPCAHESARGLACAGLVARARPARVVIAAIDPDPRTDGQGITRLRAAGIDVITGVLAAQAREAMAGFFTRRTFNRPHVTLKLALSLDGCIAMTDGASRWITGETARAHAHMERAMADAILVGRGTFDADAPKLDVRLPGLEDRSPRRIVLTNGDTPPGWAGLRQPEDVAALENVDHLLVEGGATAAAAFLARDLVDRLLIYRAPIIIGGGRPGIAGIGLQDLADAHGRWRRIDQRRLGIDMLDVYVRTR